MRRSQSIVLLVALLLVCSCKNKKPVVTDTQEISEVDTVVNRTTFDKVKLLERLKELSSAVYEGRKTGEKGSEDAGVFIMAEFEQLGVKPLQSSYGQPFKFNTRDKAYIGTNILGKIEGRGFSEKYIVISAHYDHLGVKDGKIYNGADDNASGVCALFAFAEYFKNNPPKHSVILAAFDAEELGLIGARHFVENPIVDVEKIVLNINMDMISRNVNNELYVVGTKYNQSLKNIIKSFKNPVSTNLLMGHDGDDEKQDWTLASDHGPFHLKKIPFLYFGEEDHPDYHQHTDEFKNIDPIFYKNAVEIIIKVFVDIDESFEN